MKIDILQTEFGYISYYHSNNLLLFMGSYIKKEFRDQGKFKEMLKILFLKFPIGTIIQIPLTNKKLAPLFRRLGFKKVKSIEYWGEVSNAMKLEGILSLEMIKQIDKNI